MIIANFTTLPLRFGPSTLQLGGPDVEGFRSVMSLDLPLVWRHDLEAGGHDASVKPWPVMYAEHRLERGPGRSAGTFSLALPIPAGALLASPLLIHGCQDQDGGRAGITDCGRCVPVAPRSMMRGFGTGDLPWRSWSLAARSSCIYCFADRRTTRNRFDGNGPLSQIGRSLLLHRSAG
jgi:hypothetical protein